MTHDDYDFFGEENQDNSAENTPISANSPNSNVLKAGARSSGPTILVDGIARGDDEYQKIADGPTEQGVTDATSVAATHIKISIDSNGEDNFELGPIPHAPSKVTQIAESRHGAKTTKIPGRLVHLTPIQGQDVSFIQMCTCCGLFRKSYITKNISDSLVDPCCSYSFFEKFEASFVDASHFKDLVLETKAVEFHFPWLVQDAWQSFLESGASDGLVVS